MVVYANPPVKQPNATGYGYEPSEGVARIATQLESGAYGTLVIPIDHVTYHYFETVSQDVAERVLKSGQWSATNQNPDAANAKTGTMIALLKLHAEGIPVTARLTEGTQYQQWIDTALSNQNMEHMHLSDALVLGMNGVKEQWQTSINNQLLAKSEVAGPTP